MCGRFTLKTPVLEWLSSLFPQFEDRLGPLAQSLTRANPLMARPRYNISPTQPIWTVTQFQGDAFLDPDCGPVRPMRWGLVPSWAESTRVAYSMINARSETILEKPSFKNLIHAHRCAIVADGYYEWRKPSDDPDDKNPKQPFWIHRHRERPFAMAGLWTENRRVQPDHNLTSAVIITTDANADTREVHDRMPVILPDRDALDRWLQQDARIDDLIEMLVPAATGFLEIRPVSQQVNSPRRDTPQLIDAIADAR